ncbi:MAG: glucose-6-phosphate isomerase [Spirochaetales bacterium]|jgi:glucose-6-phosphate isomerase|nr:glucose-6-phosphate isomerase [Spirochaetales bacterium]
MKLTYRNLDETRSFSELQKISPVRLAAELTPERITSLSIPTAGELTFNYAASPVGEFHIPILQQLAQEQQVIEKYQALIDGEIMNTGESRMVLHHLTRGRLGADVVADEENKERFYASQLRRIADFTESVHTREITGSTGKPFDTVVQIGIGGSDLGPRALYLALLGCQTASAVPPKMRAEFISNVDPDDAAAVLRKIDPETTLFIVVSKSGTTQETLTNQELAVRYLKSQHIPNFNPSKHMTAVTSKTSSMAASDDFLESFFIDENIGGRYSSTSAVGGLILSLAYGSEVFRELLSGAHESDQRALDPDITTNASLMDALIGIYLRNVLDLRTSSVLPYSQALSRFPAHLQQLDMESNGKQVNRFGKPLSYKTGYTLFGEPGTNGQHSFYQHLHQGSDITPLQFIGFSTSQYSSDAEIWGSYSQQKLNANLAAQIVAFAKGKQDENPNKRFLGERYSSLLHGRKLTPRSLGALLAHFENKVMFQGFIWNVNSYDQEGVQLGKKLTDSILAGTTADPALDAYVDLLR